MNSSYLPTGGAGGPPASVTPEKLAEMVKTEMAIQSMRQVVENMSQKCFMKCVPKPGRSLSSSERTCMTNCSQMYVEAHGVVSKTIVEESQKYVSSS